MDERYIIAPAALKAELFGAELNAVSAHGLLEHVLEPMIHCRTCEGILEEYAKETGGATKRSIVRKMSRTWLCWSAYLTAITANCQQTIQGAASRRPMCWSCTMRKSGGITIGI